MVFDRNTVKRSFERAASTYDEFAGLQKDVCDEVGRRLVRLLTQTVGAAGARGPGALNACPAFLDIGCGTGRLAAFMASAMPGACAVAVDIASTMVERARENHGGSIGFVAADFAALPFRDAVFDAVGSSLAFQWAKSLEDALSGAARVLRPGGLLVFSTLGPATLWELGECYKGYRGLDFMDAASVEAAVRTAGFEPVSIEARTVKRRYDGFMGLLRALKMIGAAPPMECGKGLSPGRALKEAGRLYSERFPSPEGGVEATYEVIIIEARKA